MILSERFRKFQLFFDTLFHRTSQYRELKNLKDYLHETLFEILDKKNKRVEANEESVPSFVTNIFMNRLLVHKDEMTMKQIKDSISTVVGAGFETTGTASAHCILFLAMHPEIQEKAYQEVLHFFPSDDTEITPESLTQLEFIECVMKESLRLGPTVHTIAREAMQEFEISPNKIAAKGSIFCINIYGLHRRKDLWGDDAELFNPDRFLPENFGDKQQYFIPFSVGKR
jgi:cytochrome P450